MYMLWENSQVMVIDLNKVNRILCEERGNPTGCAVKSYQWYYSRATKYPLQGATKPYLEVGKLPYTTGYYSAQLITESEQLVEVCPFEIPHTVGTAARTIVYPNPVKDFLTIENPQWQDNPDIFLYDSMGSMQRQYPSTAERQILDISGINSGTYFVRVGTAVILITVL
jgi:hypothetical protein